MNYEAIAQAVMKRIFVELEASGRHVHVTKEQAMTLFGHGLTPQRPLSQPGQYLAQERVTVQGPKGKLYNVAVLGPPRKEAQVEISLSDAKALGIAPPIRESGSVEGTPGAILVGENGTVAIGQGVIAAKRHIHLTPEAAAEFGVVDKEIVSVKIESERTAILGDVVIRVSDKFAPAMHIDTDEANAACAFGTIYGEIIK